MRFYSIDIVSNALWQHSRRQLDLLSRTVQIRVKATIAKNQGSTLIEAGNERYAILQH